MLELSEANVPGYLLQHNHIASLHVGRLIVQTTGNNPRLAADPLSTRTYERTLFADEADLEGRGAPRPA
jgi:hypothetical protein